MSLEERDISESWSISDSVDRVLLAERTIDEPAITTDDAVSRAAKFFRTIAETSYSILETLARICKFYRAVGTWLKYSFLSNSSIQSDLGAGFGGYTHSGVRMTLVNQKISGTITARITRGLASDVTFGCRVVKYPNTPLEVLATAPETYTRTSGETGFANYDFTIDMAHYTGQVALVLYFISGGAIAHGWNSAGFSPAVDAADVFSAKSNGSSWVGGTNGTKWTFQFNLAGDIPLSITESIGRILKAFRNIPDNFFAYNAFNAAFSGARNFAERTAIGIKILLKNQVVKGTVTAKLILSGSPIAIITCKVVRGPFTGTYNPANILETAPESYTLSGAIDATFTFQGNYDLLSEDVAVLLFNSNPSTNFRVSYGGDTTGGSEIEITSGTNAWLAASDPPYMKIPVATIESAISFNDSVGRTSFFERVVSEVLTWLDSVERRLVSFRAVGAETVSWLDSVARIIIQRAPFVGTKNELVKRLGSFRIHMSGNQGIPTTKEEQRARKIPKRKGFWSRWNEPDV